MDIRKALIFLLVIVLVAFVAMNLARAEIAFFGMNVQMPIGLVVMLSASLGYALGWLMAYFTTKRKPAA